MTPCIMALDLSHNMGINIIPISESHKTGVKGDSSSPKDCNTDKKKIVSRLFSEWLCSPLKGWECTIIIPFTT